MLVIRTWLTKNVRVIRTWLNKNVRVIRTWLTKNIPLPLEEAIGLTIQGPLSFMKATVKDNRYSTQAAFGYDTRVYTSTSTR